MQYTRSKIKLLASVAIAVLVLGTAGFAYAAATATPAATMAGHYRVQVAATGGHNLGTIFLPQVLNVYVGDTVTFWTPKNTLEPHTVTFGPKAMLAKLAQSVPTVVPQKHGPPIFEVPAQASLRTPSSTYSGGFANSGLLWPSNHLPSSWTVTFTKPGKYQYFCLIHFPGMTGWIVVHQRPAMGKTFTVLAGNEGQVSSQNVFFPKTLTIHAGDTVEWSAAFHTVTFAPMKVLSHWRHHFVIRTPGKPYPYVIPPQVALPSSRNGCGTKVPCMYSGGRLSSGIIVGPHFTASVFRVTFTKPGVYHYGCLVHVGMNGTIRVLP